MTFKQENRTLSISTKAGGDVLLSGFSGAEFVSSPFAFEVDLFTSKESIDVGSLLGTGAAIQIKSKEHTRVIHGLLTRVVTGPPAKKGMGGLRRLRAELRPAF